MDSEGVLFGGSERASVTRRNGGTLFGRGHRESRSRGSTKKRWHYRPEGKQTPRIKKRPLGPRRPGVDCRMAVRGGETPPGVCTSRQPRTSALPFRLRSKKSGKVFSSGAPGYQQRRHFAVIPKRRPPAASANCPGNGAARRLRRRVPGSAPRLRDRPKPAAIRRARPW